MKTGVAGGLLALVALQAAAAGRSALDPQELRGRELRVIALERGPEGERVWLGLREESRRVAVPVDQAIADGSLIDFDWSEASVTVHVVKKDPDRRLLRPWVDVRRPTFGTLQGAPFAEEGCPRFLARVEHARAWVRTGGPGEERELLVGDELCGDWLVEELQPGDPDKPGRLTLKKGERRLRVAASRP